MNMKKLLTISVLSVLPLTSFADDEQLCGAKSPETTPTSRFEILSDGAEVKDKKTNLIWQRCNIGQTWDKTSQSCTGTAKTLTWKTALSETNKLGNGNRLPNIKELQSIIEYQCAYPALNQNIFKGHDEENPWYFSSTPKLTDTGIFAINFSNIGIQPVGKASTGVARAVRSAK